jgi:hypothetical protein
MARFYGTIQGARGPASRLGHRNSGLTVTAQSYTGDIVVELSAKGDDEDYVWIGARPHYGGASVCLYCVPIKHLTSSTGHQILMREIAQKALKQRAVEGH